VAFEFQQFQVVGARMVADPDEIKTFGDVKSIRFRVAFTGERRKDGNDWKDRPVFLDCEAVQFKTGKKLAEDVASRGGKGVKVALVGNLIMEEWEDKNGGGKRKAIKLKVTEVVWLEKTEKREVREQSEAPADGDGAGYGGGGGSDDPIPF
jgi:single-strand DNA-binding protein